MAAFIFSVGCARPHPVPPSSVTDPEILAAELAGAANNDYLSGRYIEAEMELNQLLYLFPDSETARFNLAYVVGKLGRYEEAEKILIEQREVHPRDPKYRLALASLYFDAGNLERAADQYEKIPAFVEENKELLKDISDGLNADALRSLSVIRFLEGRQIDALCLSTDGLSIRAGRDDIIHHVRLLLALDRVDEADLLLKGFAVSNASSLKDAYLLHLRSLTSIAMGAFDDAYEANKRADIFCEGNDELDFEIRLVRVVLYDLSEAARKEYERSDEEDLEDLQTERLAERTQILTDKRLESEASLYWPVKFVEYVTAAAAVEAQSNDKEQGFFPGLFDF